MRELCVMYASQVRPTTAAVGVADPNDEVHMNTYVDRPYDQAAGYNFSLLVCFANHLLLCITAA